MKKKGIGSEVGVGHMANADANMQLLNEHERERRVHNQKKRIRQGKEEYDDHEETNKESSKKEKFFFSKAVQTWDAEFYVKVDKDVYLDIDGLIELFESRRGQDILYIGCMKSVEVVSGE